MQLSVLRSNNERGQNEMMKLIRYSISTGTTETAENDEGTIETTGGAGAWKSGDEKVETFSLINEEEPVAEDEEDYLI